MELIQGQNTKIESRFFELEIQAGRSDDINFSAILLHEGQVIPSANEIVQKNWCNYPDIFEFESSKLFTIDLDHIDTKHVEKVLICVDLSLSCDLRAEQVGPIALTIHDREKIHFHMNSQGRNERAVVLAEIYLRNGDWKVRALGSGYMEGMSKLLRNYQAEHLHADYVKLSEPTQETKGAHCIADQDLEQTKSPLFSGFNREPDVALHQGSVKRFEWGKHPELNVFEACGVLQTVRVDDAYFSMDMKIHMGAVLKLKDGTVIRLDHSHEADDRVDDLVWLYPEEKPEITSHTLVVAKEAFEKVSRLVIYAYINGEIPYWKKAKPRIFLKPNPDQKVEVTPDYYDMTRFSVALTDVVLGSNGVEVSTLLDYYDHPAEITL